jgi:hypothetical protein
MNGQQNGDQGNQGSQESHLSFLLNAANGRNAFLGYHGAGGAGGGGVQQHQGMRFGAEGSLEEQILQRASALRAEALMQQQQQQQHQQHHQLSAALAAFQQQQLSSLGLNPNIAALMEARGMGGGGGGGQAEQEAIFNRAAALRELGLGGMTGAGGGGMDRLQQLEMGRLEELERRRQQLAALANFSQGRLGLQQQQPDAPPSQLNLQLQLPSGGGEQLGQDNGKSDVTSEKEARAEPSVATSAEKSKDDLRKTPGTVIVPCRARGMPMDHNFKVSLLWVVNW